MTSRPWPVTLGERPCSPRMSLPRRLVAHILAVVGLLALALSMPVRAQQMSLQEFGQAHGLQNLTVNAFAQDGDGFIWAGTENGLYRFDGERFDRVGVGEKLVWISSLMVDGKRIWIVADGGLWLWQEGGLRRIDPGAPALGVEGYPQMILPDGTGGAWIVDHSRLVELEPGPGGGWRRRDVLEGQQVIEPKEAGSITSVAAGGDGDLWFGCGLRICRRHAGHFEAWGPELGVPREPWHWLLRASDGSVWARSTGHVLQLEPGAARFADRSDALESVDEYGLYPLVEDARHRILGAVRGALVRWNGHSWDRFGTAAGLPVGGRLRALLSDREGGIWLGMGGAGVLQWRGYGQWENWSVASGLPHTVVWQFARAGPPGRRTLYAATGAGVAAFDAGEARFRPLAGIAGQEMRTLASDADGALWAGAAGGRLWRLAVANGGAEGATSVGLPGAPAIYSILAGRSGGLWINADDGLHRRPPGAPDGAPAPLVEGGQLEGGTVPEGCEDRDGTTWFGGAEGVKRYAHDRWDRPLKSAAPVYVVACLHDGTLAASGGADGVRLLELAGGVLRERDVTPPELRGRAVLAMREDRRGWLWVSTDAGVAVWNRRYWRLLDQGRGLVWNDTSSNALFEDDDGTVWIGTSRGASHMIAPAGLFAPVSGRVAIRSIVRGGLDLSPRQDIRLPWSNDPIEIDLAIPVYRDRGALAVEYRLAGFDDRWTRAPHLDVRLTGLPAGRYRFEARAVDRELAIASPATGFDFEIDPPWWRSRPALAAVTAAGLALAFALYRWRVRSMTLRARELEALVSERTRELEASREQLREQATKDGLTGVWNRRALMEIVAREANRCARERLPLAVTLADIDHFKQVNDTHGHPAGDAVLREFAARLVAAVRPYDAVGRYGGEEFVIVMPGLDADKPDQRARLAAIHAAIGGAPMSIGTVTCSFGVAWTDGRAPIDVDALIAEADAALYRAKRNGRDRVEWGRDDAQAPQGTPGVALASRGA